MRLLVVSCAVALVACGAFPGSSEQGSPAPSSSMTSVAPGSGGSPAPATGGGGGAPPTPTGGAGTATSGTAGGGSPQAAGSGGTTSETPPPPAPGVCDFAHTSVVDVASASDLTTKLAAAKAGTMIRLADGLYSASFTAQASGNADAPIVLCGGRGAVLQGNDNKAVFTLTGNYWILAGFTMTGGEKGLLLDGANHNRLVSLSVHDIGHEAVHFRSLSSDNVFEYSEVYETGQTSASIGEGVYIGSSWHSWADFAGSATTPDACNRNVVQYNTIGPNVRAELIDVKEGTQDGVIRGNTLNGAGMSGEGYADSWLDMKGSDYLIEDNVGSDALADGFQIHVEYDGWGKNNAFHGNEAAVNGPGYGFKIFDGVTGTVIGCDNEVTGAKQGFANVECEP